jgi:hypothetical protein
MFCNLKNAIRETATYLWLALKALQLWRRPPPVTRTNHLVRFVETRSKFVAQTTLYGYVKTRAGTRYVSLLEDDTFAKSVNIAKWEIYLACLCDLAFYAAALVGKKTGAGNEELRALGEHLVNSATFEEEIPPERPQGFADIRTAFATRARDADWKSVQEGEALFDGSMDALVKWAPVAEELKIHDVDIVRNSMRFKWKKVRDQLNLLLDADAVMADWRSRDAGAPLTLDAFDAAERGAKP